MLLKLGVSIERLSRDMRRALNIIDAEWALWGEEAVITSANEGTHSAGSLHYGDNAVDIRMPKKPQETAITLRNKLGKDFDVVVEVDHLHVEFDPK